eukprot:7025011-Pyramimonas_sp.AAC.1
MMQRTYYLARGGHTRPPENHVRWTRHFFECSNVPKVGRWFQAVTWFESYALGHAISVNNRATYFITVPHPLHGGPHLGNICWCEKLDNHFAPLAINIIALA